ncbi:hypothetical protein [Arthrobacter sp. NEB 688]|uniref:hypothetical protein n=1 Tax=Arthrobacter sp. NEB 688 TaxID=904039 RepID=UPI001564779B|nr:hypothetical protein [Arthrobacter sp. NEB 688]QKE83235.1 hypothetical protein HL663_04275 [Arthrobacter sp. NEB 688]
MAVPPADERARREARRARPATTETPGTGTLRRAVAGSLATALVALALVVTTPTGAAVAAEEGLAVSAVSRYRLDAGADVVRATMTLDLRNTSRDTAADGGVYAYFFDAYSVPVPAGATNVRATSGGRDLAVSTAGTDDPSTQTVRIAFPDLRYDRTRRIVLGFDVPGAPPRSQNSTRVGPGYATFVAYGPGDEGHNRVEVVAPSAMSFSSTVDDFDTARSGGTSTYTATENTFDGGLWAAVSLRDAAQVTERTVEVGDLSLTLSAFPDDEQWSTFVADRVEKGLPVLERLVDDPWPGGLQRIREDASPSLRGYDGWFDPTGDEIVVGEQLDDDLIFHELTHAWVSGDTLEQRWLYEGLAQAVAERAVERTGGTPRQHDDVSRSDRDARPLNGWTGDAGSRSADVDAYAYPASYHVMHTLLADTSDARFAAAVGAAVRGERAYDPPGLVTPSGGRTSWQDWLDLVEDRAGAKNAASVMSTWVLTKEQRALLAPRERERTAYRALDRADGDWVPPEGLRDAMTVWDFERARDVRAAVAPLGASVTAVQRAASRTGLAVPAGVRDSYEQAALDDDYRDLATSLPATARAIEDVGAARDTAARERNALAATGARLLGVQERADRARAALADGSVDRASALARESTERAGWALPLGVGLLLLALVVLVGVAAVVVAAVRHRPAAARHAGAGPDRTPDHAMDPSPGG